MSRTFLTTKPATGANGTGQYNDGHINDNDTDFVKEDYSVMDLAGLTRALESRHIIATKGSVHQKFRHFTSSNWL